MRRAFPLALALLVLLAASPLAAAKDVTLPRWTVGDEWTYEVTVTENGVPIDSGERRVVVVARGPYSYQGAAREAVTLATYENMTGMSPYAFEDIVDASTGALLATRSNGETLTAVEPCVRVEYPLTYPKSWTDSCDLGHGAFETTYIVAGGESLTVPAGTFQTLSVDALGADAVRHWYSDDACGKVAELSLHNDFATYVNLTSFRCAPAPGGTVTTPGTPSAAPPTGATPPPAGTSPATTPAATPGPAPATLALPRFTSRDNWAYESTGTLRGASVRVNTTVSAVAGGDQVDLNGHVNVTDPSGATILAYRLISSIHATTGAVRREQVAPYIGVELVSAAGIPTMERRYGTPCQFVRWPITPGQDWEFSCQGTLVNMSRGGADTPFTVTGTGRAEPARQVTTPAGTFTGFPVRLSYTYSDGFSRTETRVYASDPCAYVEMTPGAWGGVDKLVGFHCAGTGKGELVPETLPDKPTPGAATWSLLAVALGAAFLAGGRRR